MKIFILSTAQVKVHQIQVHHVIFQVKSQFFFKVWIFFQCHERWFLCTFLDETWYAIYLPILSILHVIFETKSQFFFKLCITLQCHETWLFCTFSSKSFYAWDNRTWWKCKFSDFRLLAWKLTKFLMSFFKPEVSRPLNFATPFSVMTHTSLKFSDWYALGKWSSSMYNFLDFWVL